MTTNKIFLLLFFFCLSSCHVSAAKTEKVVGKLNVDGSPHDIDGVYEISGGDITFKLTE
jgi:hypothetical protein